MGFYPNNPKKQKLTLTTAAPFSHPVYILAKPAGAHCNLACEYCYYLEKKNLYPTPDKNVMGDDVLEKFIKEYIQIQTVPYVLFTWHGGEPLMRPLSFYKRAIELQKRYADGKQIDNALQTNATLITDKWADFLKENNFLVGVSIDGPEELHNIYRRTKRSLPSFRQVMKGIEILNRHGVEWNALAVVNNVNAKHPAAFYQFFKDIGCHYIQFTPVVERLKHQADGRWFANPDENTFDAMAQFSITPDDWGNFLCDIFDEWVRHDVGNTFVQIFDATLAGWVGVEPGVCTLAKTCGHSAAIESNGDIYVCDHYVFPEYLLGNIKEKPLASIVYSKEAMRFGQAKRTQLTQECKECLWLHACNGECPRLRFTTDKYGNPGHNYLCKGYKKYFAHVAPYMDYMKRQLQLQQPPSNVMQWIREGNLNP